MLRLTPFTANIIYKWFWVLCFVTIRGPTEVSYPKLVLDRSSLPWYHESGIVQSDRWHLRCFRKLVFSSLLTAYHLHPLLYEIECVLSYYKIRSRFVWTLLSAYLFLFLIFDTEESTEEVGHISGEHSDRSGTATSYSARRPIAGGSRTWCVPRRPPGGTWRILLLFISTLQHAV